MSRVTLFRERVEAQKPIIKEILQEVGSNDSIIGLYEEILSLREDLEKKENLVTALYSHNQKLQEQLSTCKSVAKDSR